MRILTNGQARRIAAEWQAPGNAYSLLQHKGIIADDLIDEIKVDAANPNTDIASRHELIALRRWATQHGPGKVPGWGSWDDRKAN